MSDLARVEEILKFFPAKHYPAITELGTIATAALDREAAARKVIQRVWEHGCCCSDDEDYCKCDMVKAAKDWLEEAQDDG